MFTEEEAERREVGNETRTETAGRSYLKWHSNIIRKDISGTVSQEVKFLNMTL